MHINMCLLFVFVRNAECLINESLLAFLDSTEHRVKRSVEQTKSYSTIGIID